VIGADAIIREADDAVRCASSVDQMFCNTGCPAFAEHDVLGFEKSRSPYFTAPKRLSNEFDETIGAEPATWAGAEAAGAGASDTDGFRDGRLAACLGSGFGAAAFGTAASGRGAGSVRLASTTFGFAGAAGGGVLAVASPEPPMPTLRARLEKNPPD
jgi:hypothetical protein